MVTLIANNWRERGRLDNIYERALKFAKDSSDDACVDDDILKPDENDNFAELLGNSAISKYKEGKIIGGVIVDISDKEVVVDVDMKCEGRIPTDEFTLGRKENEVGIGYNVGDIVRVFLERIENSLGIASLSREKAVREELWGRFVKIAEDGTIIDGVILHKVKGGFFVNIEGVIAFLPNSQVDVKMVKDVAPLIGIKQQFKILKATKNPYTLVVSRRAVLEFSREKMKRELLNNIQEEDILDGVIKNITDYGAFIDLGGVDGLLHVTDISWRRIKHPSECLTIGQKVKVKVIKFNKDNLRISLGMKQTEDNPWIGLSERYPVGSRHEGTVTNLADYGAFVELTDGVEGLVYVSEISWLKFNNNPRDLLHKGQRVVVEVLSIDEEKNKISLSIKRCQENPWNSFADRYSCGDVIGGVVRHVTDFGIFVGFDDEDVDGLIHVCDISWDEDPDAVLFRYKKGQRCRVKILSINPEKERISIGLKQIDDDPMEDAIRSVNIGDILDGVVVGEKDEDLCVNISRGVEVIVPRSEFAVDGYKSDGSGASNQSGDEPIVKVDFPATGTNIKVEVTGIEEKKRLILAKRCD